MIKKYLSIVMIGSILVNVVACSVVDTAQEKVSSARDGVVEWYENLDFSSFQDGWDNSVDYVGAQYSAAMSSEYIASLQEAITQLESDMNAAAGSARGTAQEAGLLAERWATDTFNIDAIASGSTDRAYVVGSNELGSVDVATTYGENASLKYYQSANASAQQQAIDLLSRYYEYCNNSNNPKSFADYINDNGYDPETMDELMASVTPLYNGQTRIIPADQLDAAVAYLEGRIDTITGSGDTAPVLQETLDNLRDRLQSPDGVESQPITYEEMQAITELAQEGEFVPEDFGVTVTRVISPKFILKTAMGTGLTAAALNTVFTVGPDFYTLVRESIEAGDIDEAQLEEIGIEAAISASSGFVEGSVSRTVTTLCQSGALGQALADANPAVVATITIIVIEAAIYGYKLSKGEITTEEYGNLMADKIMIGLLSVPTCTLMISVCTAIKVPALIGCIAGAMLACVGYTIARDAVMDIVDGGGFEAIVPADTVDAISVASDTIRSLNIQESLSSLGDTIVSTANDGYIRIQALFGD